MRMPAPARALAAGAAGAIAVVALVVHSGHSIRAQSPAMRWDGLLEGISVASNYDPWEAPEAANGPNRLARHAVSADGRYVVFQSMASNLGGINGWWLFRRDRATGETLSLWPDAGNDSAISGDGQHVAFTFCEPNWRPDGLPICDVYAIDLLTLSYRRLTETLDGTPGDGHSAEPVLSGNGRFVVFRTSASNLFPLGSGTDQLALLDRDADGNGLFDEPGTAHFEAISVTPSVAAGNAASAIAEVSDDGRFVAFLSGASDLVGDDTNGVWDVFLRDRQAGVTRRINVRPMGQESTAPVNTPAISMTPDGRFIAYSSADGMLAAGAIDDYNNTEDVFVYDADADFTTRLDVGWGPPAAGGYVPGNGPTRWPSLSADGRYVAVQTDATNLEVPSLYPVTQTLVYDRLLLKPTRVSIKPDLSDPDREAARPQMSSDGSVVVFVSPSSNLMPGTPPDADQIYAAVHLSVTPADATVPSGGGSAEFFVVTQQFTRWSAEWDRSQYWFAPPLPSYGVGDGMMTLGTTGANPDPAPHSTTVVVNGSSSVVFNQEAGLSISSLSPASGPVGGGTEVTVHGTGFEPGARVTFDGFDAISTQFVDSTTLVATTPAHGSGTVWVAVFLPDSRVAWLEQGFRYLDATPPTVTAIVSDGTLGDNGWYTSNVSWYFLYDDPDSPITSAVGCDPATLATDTAGTAFTCTVTSEGGSASASITLKRDATPPGGIIWLPYNEYLFKRNIYYVTDYVCGDAMSGIASCVGPVPDGGPLPTGVPGRFSFDVVARDRAGNVGGVSKPYYVSSGVCAPRPPGLVGWWPGDGHTRDIIARNDGVIVNGSPLFGSTGYSMGFTFIANRYMRVPDADALRMTNAFTLSAWVEEIRFPSPFAVIAGREGEYLLARGPNGKIHYAIANTDPGWGWVDTGVTLTGDRLTKLALTYDGSEIRLYKNGQLVYTRAASGPIGDVEPTLNEFRVAGRQSTTEPSIFDGSIDDVELVNRAMTAAEIDAAYFSADWGLCQLTTTLSFTPTPQRATFGGSAELVARLTDDQAQPIAGEQVHFTFRNVFAGTALTDAAGVARMPVSIAGLFALTYANAVQAAHPATAYLQYSSANADFVIDRAAPVVTWNAPAAVVHGTALGGAQLNATANVAGTFSYSPAAGTILPAGSQTLGVTFTPSSPNYTVATASVPLTVLKATPTVTVTGGTFTYDGTPHAATGSATGIGGVNLEPLTFTYDGVSTPPVNAGTYAVVGSFAGNGNYEAATGTATLTIDKAAPTVSVTGGTFVYDATAHAAAGTVTGAAGEALGPIAFTYNGAADPPIDAGTYAVIGSYAGDGNHLPASGTATLAIGKATPTVTASGGSFTYDGNPHPAGGSVTGVSGAVLGPLAFTYNGVTEAPRNAGTYNVVASFAGNGNYEAAMGTATLTIGKAAPTVSVTGGTFVYDATVHAAAGTVTGAAGEALGPIAFTYNGAADPPLDAGTYAVLGSYAGDGNHLAASGTATLVIGKATPAVTASGGTFTYDGNPHPADGSVTGAGGAVLGPLTFSYNGAAEAPRNAGTYDVVASFAGNGNYEAASGGATITITKATATVTVTGGTFTYDGAAHPATGTVTGVGGATLGPLTFTYNGLEAAPVSAGSYAVVGSYAGDLNHLAASGDATITVGQATPVLSWTAPGAIVYGAPLGAAQLNAAASVAGTFSYAPAAGVVLAAGAGQPLSASFTPADTVNYAGGSVAAAIDVMAAPLVVRASDAVKLFGAPLPPFGATFSGFVNGDTPASLGGALTLTTPAGAGSPVGTYPIVTGGLTSPNYAISFVGGTLMVVRAQTAVAVSSAPSPSGYEQPMAFTVTVAAVAPGAGLPTGVVRFFDGSTMLGSATLAAGSATLTTAGLDAGTRAIEAHYDGDPSFEPGIGTESHVILAASATPALTLSSSRNPANVGQSVTLTANVSMSSGPVSGLVEFFDAGTLIGTAAIVSGQARLTTSAFAAGSHAVTARYAGADGVPPSGSGVLVQAISGSNWKNRATTLSLTASPNPAALGSTIVLTATVDPSTSTMPTGRVLFMVDGVVVGNPAGESLTPAGGSNASATLSVAGLAHGRHQVTATYLGNSTFRGSTGAVVETVN